MAQLTQAFPDQAFSGIGGIAEFAQALNYFLLGCGTVQVCTAAMLDHAIGPNVIKQLLAGHGGGDGAATAGQSLDDFRGPRATASCALEDPPAGRRGLSRRLRGRGLRSTTPLSAAWTPRMTRRLRTRISSSSPRTSPAVRCGTRTSRQRRSPAAPGPPTTSPRSGSA